MSRKRARWLVAVLLIFGFVLASFWWFCLRPPYGITKRSFAKIQPGMTLVEVEAIIGTPPGLYDGVKGPSIFPIPPEAHGFKKTKQWGNQRGWIMVFLDEQDKVLDKSFAGKESTDILSKLLEWLGL